jgi:hypothetical protein
MRGGWTITKSDDGKQICRITRTISDDPRSIAFLLLHPPMLKRGEKDSEAQLCDQFTRRLHFGKFAMLYLVPYRLRNFKDVKKYPIPWGDGHENQRLRSSEIFDVSSSCNGSFVVAAWGDEAEYQGLAKDVISKYDGSRRAFDPCAGRVVPFYALEFTELGNPARLSPENIGENPQLIVRDPIKSALLARKDMRPQRFRAAS